MSENKNVVNNTQTPTGQKLTIDYVLGKIEEITHDKTVSEALSELGKMNTRDKGVEEQAKAVVEVVKAKETTNQKLIAFYQRMYRDLNPTAEARKDKIVAELFNILNNPATSPEDKDRAENILTSFI